MSPELWAQFRQMMGGVVDRSRGRLTIETLIDDLECGAVTLWAVMEYEQVVSFATTRVIDYPSRLRVFRIDNAAGRMEDALEFMPTMMRLAQEAGAHKLRIEGRDGWKAVFPDFHHVSTIIEKEVDYG